MDREFDKNPSLELLFTILEGFEPRIRDITLNVYLWGSRVYGTATSESDWDFIIIVKDEPVCGPAVPRKNINDIQKRYRVFETSRINGMLVPQTEYSYLLLENRHEALECFMLPSHHIWMQTVTFDFKIDYDVIRRTLGWEAKRRFQRASHTALTDSITRAKKEIIHSLRYMLFALQIIETGRIYDYQAANNYYYEILQDNFMDWGDVMKKWEPVRRELSLKVANAKSISRFYSRVDTASHVLNSLYFSARYSNPLVTSVEPVELRNDYLDTIKYIKSHGIAKLQRDYKVSVLRHLKKANLVFIVSHHATGLSAPIERECYNGIVVDEENQFTLVSYTFPKMDDVVSTNCIATLPTQDFTTAEVTTKEDGTFVAMYHYDGEWFIHNRYEPESEHMVLSWNAIMDQKSDAKVKDHFWVTWKQMSLVLPSDTSKVYTFELSYVKHRYIVRYEENAIILVGVTDLPTGNSVDSQAYAKEIGCGTPEIHQFDNLDSVIGSARSLNPFVRKGYVVHFKQSNVRVKVLSPLYIAVAYACDLSSIGQFNLVSELDYHAAFALVMAGTDERFLKYHPRWADYLAAIREPYEAYCNELEEYYNEWKFLPQEEFAKKAKTVWPTTTLFWCKRSNVPTPREFFATFTQNQKTFAKTWREFLARHPGKYYINASEDQKSNDDES